MLTRIRRAGIVLFAGALTTGLFGQSLPRITRRIDDFLAIRVPGTTHPLAMAANSAGRVAPGLRMERMLLLLKTAPEQQAELEKLLADLQDPASPLFHQWLTAEQYGQRFGPAEADLDAITTWLQDRGFQVDRVYNGRTAIEFSGPVRQVESAFHTEMHRYIVDGQARMANARDIAIPEALAPVVGGVVSLNDFRRRSLHRAIAIPEANVPDANLRGGAHALVPYDFAAIYNVLPLWNGGFDGTGQSIAIAGRTDIKLSDVTLFRSSFNLPGNNTQVIVNGRDPGVVSPDEETEAVLDVEWSGAVARGATVKFVVSASSAGTDGVDLSALYIVDNNIAPVMSVSFGDCEPDIGTSGNLFYGGLWSQAAAEGISVFVAAGDSGSAGCDVPLSTGSNNANTTTPAVSGFAVSGLASTPNNVAVGGTQFNDTASPSTWWNPANDANLASARGYIPELVWNESSYLGPGAPSNGLWAGSGGVSGIYATPAWQTGSSVPASDPGAGGQHHRYLPDLSLNGAGHDGYLIYQEGALGLVGGTSAGSPSMAGIMVLIDQYSGGRNGNPNPHLYALAAKAPSVYHDVTSGTNAVPCGGGSPNCSAGSGVGVLTGYNAGPGFDLATGWGSVDAYALALNWSVNGAPAPVVVSLSPNPMTAAASPQMLTITGSSFQSGATVKVGAATFSGGQVSFVNSSQLKVTVTEPSPGSVTVQVTNPDNQASNTVNLQVIAPAPVIGALTPNPMAAAAAPQMLTITGTSFQPGATVRAGAATFAGAQVTFVSASQLKVTVTATSAGSITVQVTNPDNQASNAVNLQVNAPPPVIGALTPNPMAATAAPQTLTIMGSSFQPGATVKVGAAIFSGAQVTFVSASHLMVSVSESSAATLTVQVTNPDNQASNAVNLLVNAPAPVIAALESPMIVHSTSNQILAIDGAGFQPGARVMLTYAGGSEQAGVIAATATQISALINVGNVPRAWNVQVVNPDGSGSNLATLIVK